MKVIWALTREQEARDAALVREIDEELARGARAAGPHLACRVGCIACCVGPFDISPLDGARLMAGLAALAARDPARADAVRARAQRQWGVLRAGFPGDRETRELGAEEAERAAFFACHTALPCPALEPESGACELYDHRPLTRRTFGPPVRYGPEVLPPCDLCFTAATAPEVEASTVEPDPDDHEGELLAELRRSGGRAGDTVVAAVLAPADILER